MDKAAIAELPPKKTEVFDRIRYALSMHDVVLYMKGSAAFPQCGFSAAMVQMLNQLGVAYVDVDVLSDPGLSKGIKEYANFPMTPQLYVRGEFVGGCDIVRALYASGELKGLMKEKGLLS